MLKVDIHMTDRVTGQVRTWPEDDQYDTSAFGEDGWADYMWSDGNMGHGQNRAMYFAMAGKDAEIEGVDDARFHVKIVNRDTGETLYDDGEGFGEG